MSLAAHRGGGGGGGPPPFSSFDDMEEDDILSQTDSHIDVQRFNDDMSSPHSKKRHRHAPPNTTTTARSSSSSSTNALRANSNTTTVEAAAHPHTTTCSTSSDHYMNMSINNNNNNNIKSAGGASNDEAGGGGNSSNHTNTVSSVNNNHNNNNSNNNSHQAAVNGSVARKHRQQQKQEGVHRSAEKGEEEENLGWGDGVFFHRPLGGRPMNNNNSNNNSYKSKVGDPVVGGGSAHSNTTPRQPKLPQTQRVLTTETTRGSAATPQHTSKTARVVQHQHSHHPVPKTTATEEVKPLRPTLLTATTSSSGAKASGGASRTHTGLSPIPLDSSRRHTDVIEASTTPHNHRPHPLGVMQTPPFSPLDSTSLSSQAQTISLGGGVASSEDVVTLKPGSAYAVSGEKVFREPQPPSALFSSTPRNSVRQRPRQGSVGSASGNTLPAQATLPDQDEAEDEDLSRSASLYVATAMVQEDTNNSNSSNSNHSAGGGYSQYHPQEKQGGPLHQASSRTPLSVGTGGGGSHQFAGAGAQNVLSTSSSSGVFTPAPPTRRPSVNPHPYSKLMTRWGASSNTPSTNTTPSTSRERHRQGSSRRVGGGEEVDDVVPIVQDLEEDTTAWQRYQLQDAPTAVIHHQTAAAGRAGGGVEQDRVAENPRRPSRREEGGVTSVPAGGSSTATILHQGIPTRPAMANATPTSSPTGNFPAVSNASTTATGSSSERRARDKKRLSSPDRHHAQRTSPPPATAGTGRPPKSPGLQFPSGSSNTSGTTNNNNNNSAYQYSTPSRGGRQQGQVSSFSNQINNSSNNEDGGITLVPPLSPHSNPINIGGLAGFERQTDSGTFTRNNSTPGSKVSSVHALSPPWSPEEALRYFRSALTAYEQSEILDYPQVYYCGSRAVEKGLKHTPDMTAAAVGILHPNAGGLGNSSFRHPVRRRSSLMSERSAMVAPPTGHSSAQQQQQQQGGAARRSLVEENSKNLSRRSSNRGSSLAGGGDERSPVAPTTTSTNRGFSTPPSVLGTAVKTANSVFGATTTAASSSSSQQQSKQVSSTNCVSFNTTGGGLGLDFDDEENFYRVRIGDHIAYRYEILQVLGTGTFGVVVHALDWAMDMSSDGAGPQHCALKIARNETLYSEAAEEEGFIMRHISEQLSREQQQQATSMAGGGDAGEGSSSPTPVLISPKSPRQHASAGVAEQYGLCPLLHSFTFRQHKVLVFPLYGSDLGALLHRVPHQPPRPIPHYLTRAISAQLVQAVGALHRHGVLHTDIKPDNIVFADTLHTMQSSTLHAGEDAARRKVSLRSPRQFHHRRQPHNMDGSSSSCANADAREMDEQQNGNNSGRSGMVKLCSSSLGGGSGVLDVSSLGGGANREQLVALTSRVILIDYGNAKLANLSPTFPVQSPYYRAPEAALQLPYTASMDMWSVGCVLYELAAGKPLMHAPAPISTSMEPTPRRGPAQADEWSSPSFLAAVKAGATPREWSEALLHGPSPSAPVRNIDVLTRAVEVLGFPDKVFTENIKGLWRGYLKSRPSLKERWRLAQQRSKSSGGWAAGAKRLGDRLSPSARSSSSLSTYSHSRGLSRSPTRIGSRGGGGGVGGSHHCYHVEDLEEFDDIGGSPLDNNNNNKNNAEGKEEGDEDHTPEAVENCWIRFFCLLTEKAEEAKEAKRREKNQRQSLSTTANSSSGGGGGGSVFSIPGGADHPANHFFRLNSSSGSHGGGAGRAETPHRNDDGVPSLNTTVMNAATEENLLTLLGIPTLLSRFDVSAQEAALRRGAVPSRRVGGGAGEGTPLYRAVLEPGLEGPRYLFDRFEASLREEGDDDDDTMGEVVVAGKSPRSNVSRMEGGGPGGWYAGPGADLGALGTGLDLCIPTALPVSPPAAAHHDADTLLLLDFILGCLSWTPEERLTAAEAAHHPWIALFFHAAETSTHQASGSTNTNSPVAAKNKGVGAGTESALCVRESHCTGYYYLQTHPLTSSQPEIVALCRRVLLNEALALRHGPLAVHNSASAGSPHQPVFVPQTEYALLYHLGTAASASTTSGHRNSGSTSSGVPRYGGHASSPLGGARQKESNYDVERPPSPVAAAITTLQKPPLLFPLRAVFPIEHRLLHLSSSLPHAVRSPRGPPRTKVGGASPHGGGGRSSISSSHYCIPPAVALSLAAGGAATAEGIPAPYYISLYKQESLTA